MPSEVDVNLDGMTPTPSKNSKEAIGEDPTKKNEPQTTDIVTMNTKTGKAADKEKSAKEKPKEGEKGDSKEPNNQEGDKKEKSEHKSQEQKKSLKVEQKSAKSLKTDITQRSVKPKQPKKKVRTVLFHRAYCINSLVLEGGCTARRHSRRSRAL